MAPFFKFISAALAITLLFSCSSTQKLPSDLTANPLKHDLETLVVMGINDFHGSLAAQDAKTREAPGIEPIPYQRGGAPILARHAAILRSQFGNHFLLLDAGDEFQGSIESNLEKGAPVVQLLNAIGVNAAAVGNHEFDFGLEALKVRMSEAKYPYLAANILEKSTGQMPAFPNTFRHLLLTPGGRLKVGVIGLSTLETPTTTRPEFVASLEFSNLRESTLREAEALRKEGAQLILVLAHVGLKCNSGRVNSNSIFHKPSDPQGDCDPKEELVSFLNSLPEGAVDAVVSGHSHQIVHHWVGRTAGTGGVPVIQGGAYNQYYNLLYLTYDWTQKKLLKDRTRIEGPIPICPKIFENQGDCNGDRPPPLNGRGALITPRLHGHAIEPESKTADLLEPVFRKTAQAKSRVLAQAIRPIQPTRTAESEAGNLIADAIREKIHADVALMNPGGIRAPFESGPITYGDLFRTLPFDNATSRLTLTGKELKLLLRIAESGPRGYFPVAGLQLRVLNLEADAPTTDLNQNGKTEPWEINRLIDVKLKSVKLKKGSRANPPLNDSKLYTVAIPDFLVSGGDDMGWFMAQIPKERILLNAGGTIRDAVEEFLIRAGTLNSPDRPLVDPRNPRIRIELSRSKHAKTKRKQLKK